MDNRNTAHRYSLALATLLASQSALAAPEYIESELNSILRHADLQTKIHGKSVTPALAKVRNAHQL